MAPRTVRCSFSTTSWMIALTEALTVRPPGMWSLLPFFFGGGGLFFLATGSIPTPCIDPVDECSIEQRPQDYAQCIVNQLAHSATSWVRRRMPRPTPPWRHGTWHRA